MSEQLEQPADLVDHLAILDLTVAMIGDYLHLVRQIVATLRRGGDIMPLVDAALVVMRSCQGRADACPASAGVVLTALDHGLPREQAEQFAAIAQQGCTEMIHAAQLLDAVFGEIVAGRPARLVLVQAQAQLRRLGHALDTTCRYAQQLHTQRQGPPPAA